jgi:hypothetical protein
VRNYCRLHAVHPEVVTDGARHGSEFLCTRHLLLAGAGDNHATHVAGTIGAAANGMGVVVGVNWNVKLVSAKVLQNGPGNTFSAVRAVEYITSLKTHKGLNIVAISNSWGIDASSKELYFARMC